MDPSSTNSVNRKPLVLLVDDVPNNLRVVGSILREDDLEIAVATSGDEALAFVKDDPPDLILLDVMMPGKDGYETCRELKRNRSTASIPVIFLTARTDTEDVVRGFDAGGVDYIIKPFRPAELRARVRTHLQLRQLKRLLAVCSYCGRIRSDKTHWEPLEEYIRHHTQTEFSHGFCPQCLLEHASDFGMTQEQMVEWQQKRNRQGR